MAAEISGGKWQAALWVAALMGQKVEVRTLTLMSIMLVGEEVEEEVERWSR